MDSVRYKIRLHKKVISEEGYRKLKVFNEYHVVHRVDKKEVFVFILAAGTRRNQEAYAEAIKRLTQS